MRTQSANFTDSLKKLISILLEKIFNRKSSEIDRSTKPLIQDANNAKTEVFSIGINGEKNIAHILDEFKERSDMLKNDAVSSILHETFKLKQEKAQVDNLRNLTDEELEEREINKIKPQIQGEYSKHYAKHLEADRNKHEAVLKLTDVRAWLNGHKGPVKESFLHGYKFSLLIILMILGLEVGYFTPILEAHGFNFGLATFGAVSFSGILIYFSEMTGYTWDKSRRALAIFLFLGFSFLGFVIFLRISVDDKHSKFTAPAIAFLYLTSVSSAIMRHKSKERSDHLTLEIRLNKKINTCERVMIETRAEGEAVLVHGEQLAKQNAQTEKNRLVDRSIELGAKIERNDQRILAVIKGFETFTKQQVAGILKSHEDGLSRHYARDTAKGPNAPSPWNNTVLTLLLIVTFSLFTACIPDKMQQDVFYGYALLDDSYSYDKNFSSKKLSIFFINEFNIKNPADNGFKGKIEWSLIGDSILPKISEIPIPNVPHLFMRNRIETQKALDTFEKGLDSKFSAFFDTMKGAESTQFYHNLSNTLNRIANTHSTKATLILMSDVVDESRIINMAQLFKEDQNAINEKYDSIKKIFLNISSVPRLTNLNVKIIGTDDGNSDLTFHCRNFWKRFLLEECSVKSVEILPNL